MKYRITMWNPDAEEKSKVVVEKEVKGDLLFKTQFAGAVWAYVTRQPFITAILERKAVNTMVSERSYAFPLRLGGSAIVMGANNDDYTEYRFERLE